MAGPIFLAQLMINALFEAFSSNQQLSDSYLAKAIMDIVPLPKTVFESIQKLQRWAYDRARLAGPRE